LSIQTIKADIDQELGGLTFWAVIISFCVPLANDLLNRKGIKTYSIKIKRETYFKA
jgi:hypothetical protein